MSNHTFERNYLVTTTASLDWEALDDRAVDTIRGLAMDAVQKVGNGHPGTAMSLAPAAYLLFQKVMRHDPSDPKWIARDRFVLSCGHSSLTLYAQLFLGGFGLELDDIKALRTWDSLTPGHPEYGHTAGVETTTGPLGQGVANAIGMAMAARHQRGLLDPNTAEASIFDHFVYVLCSDGDLQEGVSAEASSIAGVQQLGNLVVIYDDNRISIEDDTAITFAEDVSKRYEAYGWHVQDVDWTNGGTEYREDISALYDAIQAARAETTRPSFINLRTIIAWPAPNAQGTGKSHGSALGTEEVAATKQIMGMDPAKSFEVAQEVLDHTRSLVNRGSALRAEWDQQFAGWASNNPEAAQLLQRLRDGKLPDDWAAGLPTFETGSSGADPKTMSTRKASGVTIQALAQALPELWGGSADLADSNNTTIESSPSFIPVDRSTKMWSGDPIHGRVLHFGIREHAMGAIMNGIAVHGESKVFGGTFLAFSDYMRGAVRLAALMKLPVVYVWTHDSIGLGEDGPTHQPVEHLAALRAIPGLDIVRPADANETAAAWQTIVERSDRPAGLILTRQDVPIFPRGDSGFADTSLVKRGGYVLIDPDGTPDVILIATGSEVQIAVAARERLIAQGVSARVVSMPCLEWFFEQDPADRESVLPRAVKARVSIEAGISQGWHRIVGDHGRSVSLEHVGASADYARLYDEFGITAEAATTAALESLKEVSGEA
ncbi:MAG: transketolase [Marmoricola sp.]